MEHNDIPNQQPQSKMPIVEIPILERLREIKLFKAFLDEKREKIEEEVLKIETFLKNVTKQ